MPCKGTAFALLNNAKSSMTRSKMTDVATVVMEEQQRPSSGGGQTDGLQRLHRNRNTTPTCREDALFCCVKLVCRNGRGEYPTRANGINSNAVFWKQTERKLRKTV